MPTYNHVLVLQVNGVEAEPEIHEGSVRELIEIVAKVDEETARKMEVAENRLAAIAEAAGDPDKAVEYYRLQSAQAGFDEFLMRELENRAPEEQQKMIDARHLAASLMFLHEGYNYSGRVAALTKPVANLSWPPYQWVRSSSFRAWGGNVLFERPWYLGRRWYGIGTIECPDVRLYGWDGVAGSYAPLG